MDTQFEWRDEYNIGVDVVDQEHQRLFKIIDKLFAFRGEEKRDSQWTCQEGIRYFKSHAAKHFADEEAYMASIGYEGLEEHRHIHKTFRENTLPALEQELERTDYAPDAVNHFLGVCVGWLIGHTLTEDQAITGRRERKWTRLLPGEEREAMQRAVQELISSMFQLESQMISDAYSGEKFGNGIYHRLVYGAKGDERRQEVFLVLEEKLVINTVGKIMGLQTDKLDTMLVHAARYTSRQFVSRVMEYLPAMKGYELKEENLLTYSQFQKVFEKETFQASMLFSAGEAGYFAYCVIAPHLLENRVGTPLEHGNAMSEVEQFLMRREQRAASGKPKVLIVDDSLTVRQAIKQLLDESYEVSMAESGVAAIRAITLNPPDLMLLDYEMPVCDGKQTLEMIRSDAAFADLPVIFLTSRRDTQSMIQVMPLKPSGYLLKTSKPAELKKEIDAFFEKRKKKE